MYNYEDQLSTLVLVTDDRQLGSTYLLQVMVVLVYHTGWTVILGMGDTVTSLTLTLTSSLT
jgi:hypothetical protein